MKKPKYIFKKTSREDIIWAAGLFEGEGCITTSRKSPTLQLQMTDKDVVAKFKKIINCGSKIYKSDRNGYSSGINSPRRKYKSVYMWAVGNFENMS